MRNLFLIRVLNLLCNIWFFYVASQEYLKGNKVGATFEMGTYILSMYNIFILMKRNFPDLKDDNEIMFYSHLSVLSGGMKLTSISTLATVALFAATTRKTRDLYNQDFHQSGELPHQHGYST